MTKFICTERCWTPVPCPVCGRALPPLGRSVPMEMYLSLCCDDARMDSTLNTRHLWNEAEAEDFAKIIARTW